MAFSAAPFSPPHRTCPPPPRPAPPPTPPPHHHDMEALDQEVPVAKRRKVRKGTRSCWECKRRKAKCVFDGEGTTVCVGCQRRHTRCVAQELPEELAPPTSASRHLSHRLSRVEDCIKGFLAGQVESPASTSPSFRESPGDPSPHLSSPVSTPESHGRRISTSESADHVAIRHLLAAFPTESDARLLLKESAKPSLYTLIVNTQPHSRLTRETLAALSPPATELPGPNTHPVTAARLMFLFSIALQSPSRESLVGLSEPLDVLMHRLVAAATTWVTTQEEMNGTIDYLVCIILEGVYQINRGNLRKSWLAYRRAMTVAQLMGLHRPRAPPLKRIDSTLDVQPDVLWFRIVYMDRYLSLMLGVPQGTPDVSMGSPATLELDTPLGAFERRLTVIASRILERNDGPFHDDEIRFTQTIDSELLKASQDMPSSFWRSPSFQGLTPGSPETLLETLRLGAQVYYYGLLVQLHLPYTMRLRDNKVQEYSKMTCINASREIMARFVTHRTFNPLSSCSRPVDFFARLAGITLLLAHLDTHHHRDEINILAHQRLSDRALLSQALEKMDVVSKTNTDAVTEKSAELLRRLLDIEAEAAGGASFITTDDGDATRNGGSWHDGSLSLQVPYLGVIKITPQGPISREPRSTTKTSQTSTGCPKNNSPPRTNAAELGNEQPPACPMGQDASLCPNGSTSGDGTVSPGLHEPPQAQYDMPNQDNIFVVPSHDDFPSLPASAAAWNPQDVDTAFFDTLMRGISSEELMGFGYQKADDENPILMDQHT
ncbi:C6 zinc finger domain protein [Nemania sp. NC0429]|nr:C6 zinc finger domain protein [Nemania sp. NC0429]